jgi:phenylalanyl-tRNA synthetase beta chain
MKAPLAWLREYVDLPAGARNVAAMLAKIGFPVAAIEERPVVTGVLAGRIAELSKHPNADRLQVGKIDVGDGKLLTVATAATNVAQGQTIPVAVIGAKLPHLTIEPRKMRGVESEGMMVSAEELALPAPWFEDGIMQLEADLPPGTDVVEYFRLTEPVLDVEITSNRVDAMSMIGLARELAAYQGVPLRARTGVEAALSPALESSARVSIESASCRFFALQEFAKIRIGPAPAWMRIRLALAGQRPINNVVDVSNYVMLETGQPLHFYDADKIPHEHLIVRDARAGETLVTLDGEQHELSPKDLVVASEGGAEGLAGLMGGAHSEVSDATTAILLEAATFEGARVRRMSARHGFRTEASARHEKTLPTGLAIEGARRAAELLVNGGAIAGALRLAGEQDASISVELPFTDVKRLLGYALTPEEMREYLDRLGFAVTAKDAQTLVVTPPWWRRDVTVSADVVEDLARMAGYERIEGVLPSVAQHAIESGAYHVEMRAASTLCALGYREIVTVALHGRHIFDLLERAGIEPSREPVEILNPLSEDQRFLRYALGPQHLQYCARFDRPVRIFEIGHTFWREDGVPAETRMASFVFSAASQDAQTPWRDAQFLRLKGDAEALLHSLTGRRDYAYAAREQPGAHPGKSAALLLDGREIAFVCRFDPRMERVFGAELPVYGCWIALDDLPEYRPPVYRPPSKFPSTYRDLALICDPDLPAAELEAAIRKAAGPLCTNAAAFDEYRGAQVGAGKKSVAVRVTFARSDATITDAEADAAVATALGTLERELGVILRA